MISLYLWLQSIIPGLESYPPFLCQDYRGVLLVDFVEVSAEGGRLDCDLGPIGRVINLPVGQSA
jgi:hypothetical protein